MNFGTLRPTKYRLIFVGFVALPIVSVTNVIDYLVVQYGSEELIEYYGFLAHLLLVYLLALIFVPVSQFLISIIIECHTHNNQ